MNSNQKMDGTSETCETITKRSKTYVISLSEKKNECRANKISEEIIAEPNFRNLVKTINLHIEDEQGSKEINPKIYAKAHRNQTAVN